MFSAQPSTACTRAAWTNADERPCSGEQFYQSTCDSSLQLGSGLHAVMCGRTFCLQEWLFSECVGDHLQSSSGSKCRDEPGSRPSWQTSCRPSVKDANESLRNGGAIFWGGCCGLVVPWAAGPRDLLLCGRVVCLPTSWLPAWLAVECCLRTWYTLCRA